MGDSRMKNAQKHLNYITFLGHRLSGLLLAIFLPFHFLVLGMALDQQSQLDTLLKWSDQPLVKIAEWGLVILLALHLGFGLRILIIEYLPWVGTRKNLIIASAIFATLIAIAFLLRAF